MYYQLTIETKTQQGLIEALKEALEFASVEREASVMRPTYAINANIKKSVKRTYWYVDWNNYMGSGSIKTIRLTRDEYLRLKGGGGRNNPDLPNVWPYETEAEAERSLDEHYCD